MQCPKCGKTGFVNIGGERLCSSCGAKLAAASKPASLADITTTHKTLDLRSANKVAAAAPIDAAPTPAAATKTNATPAAAGALPAGQMHSRQAMGPKTLDLRAQAQPQPASPPTTQPQPTAGRADEPTAPAPGSIIQPTPPAPKADAAPEPAAPPQPSTPPPATEPTPEPAPEPTPEPTPEPQPTPAPTPKPEPEPKPSLAPEPAVPVATPAPAATAAHPISPSTVMPSSTMIQKFPPRPEAAQTTTDTAANIAATHVDAMSSQAASAPPPPSAPQSPALQQALAAAKRSTTTPSVLKVGVAVIAIGAMAGLVWLQNSPKLAFHNAAAKAGIDATLPTYIPSSYHQNGPVSASAGQLSLQFTNPNASTLKITQQETSWDSTSLRDNYVSHQTDNYLAIQGQGLTIYLYDNEADWINHGVWYQVTGVANLSREEILKIAYGL